MCCAREVGNQLERRNVPEKPCFGNHHSIDEAFHASGSPASFRAYAAGSEKPASSMLA